MESKASFFFRGSFDNSFSAIAQTLKRSSTIRDNSSIPVTKTLKKNETLQGFRGKHIFPHECLFVSWVLKDFGVFLNAFFFFSNFPASCLD